QGKPRRRIHEEVRSEDARLVRRHWLDRGCDRAREAAEELETRVEARADREGQPGVEGSLSGAALGGAPSGLRVEPAMTRLGPSWRPGRVVSAWTGRVCQAVWIAGQARNDSRDRVIAGLTAMTARDLVIAGLTW